MRLNVWMLCFAASLALIATAEAQPGGGRGGRGGGMFGGGGGGGVFGLAGNEAVQKELALTDDATTKVKAVTDDYRAAIREAMTGAGGGGNFQDMTQEERAKMREKMTEIGKSTSEKFLPKLKDALSADQFTRLQQISWQVMGTGALSEPEVVKALPISKDQQDKIKAINTEYDAKRTELFAGGGGAGGGREAFQQNMEKMQTMNKERDAKITEVLTKAQQDKFASIKGKEFDVSQLGGGRGGPGGGGGGGGGGGAGGGGRAKRPQPKAE